MKKILIFIFLIVNTIIGFGQTKKSTPTPEEYLYSSAKFYETGFDAFNILTHYAE